MGPIVAGRLGPRTIGPMPQPDRNPLAATRRLLVDGTNLLYALSKTATGRSARGAHRPAAWRDPGRHRPSSSSSTDRPSAASATSGSRPGSIVRYSGGRTADDLILADDRRRSGARRRRRHGDAPGRDRRPRPAPRRATPRRADGRLRVAARAARGRSALVAVGRQSATGAHLAARAVRSRAVVLAGTVERRRPGRDGPSQVEDRARRHDQTGQPQAGSQGGWDW